MDIRKLLDSHKEIDDDINLKLEEVAQLRALAERCTRRITDVRSGGGIPSDRVGSNAVKIADLENRIDARIDELVELKDKIMYFVTALDDPGERVVIERHYILHESFEVIAEKMGYSPRHVMRLHRSALDNLDRHFAKIMLSA